MQPLSQYKTSIGRGPENQTGSGASRLGQISRVWPTFPNGHRSDLQNSEDTHSLPRVIFRSMWFLSIGCSNAASFARELPKGSGQEGMSKTLNCFL